VPSTASSDRLLPAAKAISLAQADQGVILVRNRPESGECRIKALGGLRRARKDSPNTGWRNGGFRGYADYMQTEEFQDALEALIHMSRRKRVAIMCAEAVPWRCHRSLVADALCVRGVPAVEILSDSSYRMHTLTPFAQVEGVRITYPPDQGTLL